MFRFEHPEHLYFLLLIPAVLGGYALHRWAARRRQERLGEADLLRQLVPDHSRGKPRLKLILYLLALGSLIFAWANPQLGVEQKPARREAADVYIALDVSRSMLAEDQAPNRLERAKRMARDLVRAIRSERMATILFAGYAYIQTPLTADFAQVDLLLRSARPDLIDYQGTAIGEAIDLVLQMAPEKEGTHSALILFTDGESHEGEWEEPAAKAREQGVVIYTVGLGSERGAPIPETLNGRSDFVRDREGQVVQTRLNSQLLQALAEAGGGSYLPASLGGRQVVGRLSEALDELEKQEFDQPVYGEYRSYFQYFIGLSLLFLILEAVLSDRRTIF